MIYRWRVTPGAEEAFAAAWSAVTKFMRAEVEGARGSVLLRDEGQFVAIARWTSRAAWEAARARSEDPRIREQAATMGAVATRLAEPEVLAELADLTVAGET